MKHVYILNFYYGDGTKSNAWSGEVYSSMKGACRYGERIFRKYGYHYRVMKEYVKPDLELLF